MLEPLILSSVGDALRRAGFHSLGDLEFSVFGKSWIGDKLGVSGGERYHVQDRYLDHSEKLEKLAPMVRAVLKELFNLREPGIRTCLVMMGFLGEEHLPKTRAKKAAREDLEYLMKKAVDPFIQVKTEDDYPEFAAAKGLLRKRPARGFRKSDW
jgi:hypothetical protein